MCGKAGTWQDRQTATTVDGTHPTGMHSCFRVIFMYCIYEV